MDWFKMQTVWGAPLERLSDAEAGRFIKAIYAFVRRGDEYQGGSGREDPVTWQAMETLREEVKAFKNTEANLEARKADISSKRSQAAKGRWDKQKDANASNCMQMNANADDGVICNAIASQNKNIDIKENSLKRVKESAKRFTPPTFDEVSAYCNERGNKVNPQTFIDFYSSKGWKIGQNTMKDWKACVRTWEQRDGQRSPQKPKVLRAQDYEQREYHEEEMRELLGVDDLYREDAG